MKIAQLIPYFGKWPVWMDLYTYSVALNPMVDFIYYTDCPKPQNAPRNMIFHQMTFDAYKAMANEKFGMDFMQAKPYKLCDLRPFYAYISEEDLKGYNF